MSWLEPKSARDIQIFLGFASFYKRFIRNLSRIIISFISILQTIDHKTQNTPVKNQKVARSASTDSNISGNKDIKNLLTIIKLAKLKKLDFAKAKPSRIDFITFGAQKAFIYLQKAFIKTLIFRHFNPECHIYIKTNTTRYAIGNVLSQMTLDHHSSNHITYKNLDCFKSKID